MNTITKIENWLSFKKLTIIFFVLLFISSALSLGYYHPDEHFQTLEMANYLVFGNLTKAWEFDSHLRSFGPAYFFSLPLYLYKILHIESVYLKAFLCRFWAGVFSFSQIIFFFYFFITSGVSKKRSLLLSLGNLLLWSTPYLMVRTSSENLTTSFSTLAFISGWLSFYGNYPDKKKNSLMVLSGFLWGVAFIFRFPSVLLAIGFSLYVFYKKEFKLFGYLCLGGASGFLLYGGIDYHTYGVFLESAINYARFNLLSGSANKAFGTQPFYYFFLVLLAQYFVPFLVFSSIFFYRAVKSFPKFNWVLATVFPFLFLHSFVGHKEWRFIFPILPFLQLIIFYGFSNWLDKPDKKSFFKRIIVPMYSLNLLLLILFLAIPQNNRIIEYQAYSYYSGKYKVNHILLPPNLFSYPVFYQPAGMKVYITSIPFSDLENYNINSPSKKAREFLENDFFKNNRNTDFFLPSRNYLSADFSQEYSCKIIAQTLPDWLLKKKYAWVARTPVIKLYMCRTF